MVVTIAAQKSGGAAGASVLGCAPMPTEPQPLPFSRAFMLARARARDARYDGRFLTCVRSTGIYCLPSCRARTPNPENVVHAATPEQARAMGFRACQRCRPDDHFAGRDADREALVAAVAAARATPGDFGDPGDLAARSGFGASKLAALCRRHYHRTPAELLLQARLQFAQVQLRTTARPLLDVALDSGFASSSTFHARFAERTGTTPGGYRRLGDDATFALQLPRGLDPDALLAHLGRDPEAACERVAGRTAWLALPLDDAPAVLELRFDGEVVLVRVDGPGGRTARYAAHAVVARLVNLDGPTAAAERHFAGSLAGRELLAGNRGQRIALAPSPWTALVWAIAGQQVNLRFCCALRAALARRCGQRVGDLHAHPTAAAVAELDSVDLRALRWSGAKAEHLIAAARAIAAGEPALDALLHAPATAAEPLLRAMPGIGPWTARYVLLRGLGCADALPAGDSALASSMQRWLRLDHRPDAREQEALALPFAPHRSLLCWWLWRRFAADCRAADRTTREDGRAMLPA